MVKAQETATTLIDNNDGTFTYTNENSSTVTFNANTLAEGGITSSDLVVNGGDLSTFKDVTLEIAEGAVGTAEIADGSVTFNKIANGRPDAVITTNEQGNLMFARAAMPKVFYMPSVYFDTSALGTSFEKDLYQEYVNQFSNPMVSSRGDSYAIPTMGRNELTYNITYYDNTVFANVSINSDGVLEYDIIGTPTPASFMNIVFVVD